MPGAIYDDNALFKEISQDFRFDSSLNIHKFGNITYLTYTKLGNLSSSKTFIYQVQEDRPAYHLSLITNPFFPLCTNLCALYTISVSPKESKRNIVNLGEFLPPFVRPDFGYGRIEIEGRYYYLSGRIPLEVRAPDFSDRKKTTAAIISSRQVAMNLLAPLAKIVGSVPPFRPNFVSIFADRESGSARVGVAARVELDNLKGKFSVSDERFLQDALKSTISHSDKHGNQEKIKEMEGLVRRAALGEYNLLPIFALDGFFVVLLRREEERIKISSHEGILVPFTKRTAGFENRERLLEHPSELVFLYFLLRAKQLGGERVRVLTPSQWIALVNYRDFLSLREFSLNLAGDDKGYWTLPHPGPIEKIYDTGEKGEKTPLAIKIPPFGISGGIIQESASVTSAKPPRKRKLLTKF